MYYDFPEITHINDILYAIGDRDDFYVSEKEWGSVVNYIVNTPETFSYSKETHEKDVLRRECRGLKFDHRGRVLARPYHKFFNYGEKPETLNFDIATEPHIILEKLDGSMVHPIMTDRGKTDSHWRLCTKNGITEISMQAECWVADGRKNYVNFFLFMFALDMTPIFEWCSRKNRIVIDHPVDRLVLTAVRDNKDGHYMSYSKLEEYGRDFNIEVVKKIDSFNDMNSLLEYTKNLKDAEGFVIRFNNGHMLKIKADEYVVIHKAKNDILMEKNVVALFLSDKYDDVIAMLPDHDKKRVCDFYLKFWDGIHNSVNHFIKQYNDAFKASNGDRKTFAIEYAKEMKTYEPYLVSYIFSRWGNDNVSKADTLTFIKNCITKKCGSKSGIDEVRHLWNNHVYSVENEVLDDDS